MCLSQGASDRFPPSVVTHVVSSANLGAVSDSPHAVPVQASKEERR